MTYEEAKGAAIAAFMAQGMSQDEAAATVTMQDIKLFGWVPTDPTASVDTSAAIAQADVQAHVAAALQEAKDNQILTNAIKFLSDLAMKAISSGILPLFLVLVLLLPAGCSSVAGQKLVDDANVSLTKYVTEKNQFATALIEEKKNTNLATADELFQDAVASHTQTVTVKVATPVIVKTVAADGKVTETQTTEMRDAQVPQIDPRVMAALQAQKGKAYAATLGVASAEYARSAQIDINAANAAQSIGALGQYLGIQAQNQVTMSQILDTANSILAQFLASKQATSSALTPATATPLPAQLEVQLQQMQAQQKK